VTIDAVLEAPGQLIDRDHEHEVEEELEPRGKDQARRGLTIQDG
jgi:hypothetical protein